MRELRAQHGWSQAELAERVGVSRQSVNAIEGGRQEPSLPLAFRIAQALGTRIDVLFERAKAGRSGAR